MSYTCKNFGNLIFYLPLVYIYIYLSCLRLYFRNNFYESIFVIKIQTHYVVSVSTLIPDSA